MRHPRERLPSRKSGRPVDSRWQEEVAGLLRGSIDEKTSGRADPELANKILGENLNR